jgi:hypothetical protein
MVTPLWVGPMVLINENTDLQILRTQSSMSEMICTMQSDFYNPLMLDKHT